LFVFSSVSAAAASCRLHIVFSGLVTLFQLHSIVSSWRSSTDRRRLIAALRRVSQQLFVVLALVACGLGFYFAPSGTLFCLRTVASIFLGGIPDLFQNMHRRHQGGKDYGKRGGWRI